MNRAARRTKPTAGAVSKALAQVQNEAVSEADAKAKRKLEVTLQGYDDALIAPIRRRLLYTQIGLSVALAIALLGLVV